MQATRRRLGTPAWLGLVLVVGLPALAEAQLLPNRTVNRQREACAAEPPFYSTVRRNYFGYYPTCWNRFPAGWGCPCFNPEAPNRVAEFEKQKRDPLPTNPPDTGANPDEMGEEPTDPAGARPETDPRIPALPDPGRRPFDRETAPPDNVPRRNVPDTTTPPQSSRSNRPPVPSADLPPTTGLLEMPRVVPPVAYVPPVDSSSNPGTLALAPDATLASNQPSPRPELGPLPAAPLPAASTPAVAELGTIDPSLLSRNTVVTNGLPAQAPQRKGMLGGLFNSSKRRR